MADPSDLFHHPHHFSFFSDSGSGSGSEPNCEDPDFLGLGFGLGLGFPNQEDDWTDDDFFVGGPRHVELPGYGPEADVDYIVGDGHDPDPDPDPIPSLCWNRLRIEDEFEWEEIDDPHHAAAAAAAAGLVLQYPIGIRESDDEVVDVEAVSNWEVLLTVNGFGSPHEDSYVAEDHNAELAYTSEYDEVLFDQFQEQEGSTKGGPPAAMSVVEGLPTVTLKEEERAGGGPVNCAVCKDEFEGEERVKKLPCGHYYHEDCILPWLGMRNTCPLCRYELPTDDVEYESRKARRGSVVPAAEEEEEVRVRYDFQMLPGDLDASNY